MSIIFNPNSFINKTFYSLSITARIFGWKSIKKHCVCCGYRGRFGTIGHPPRFEAICPACGSLERHRLIALTDNEEHFFTDKEVLHFAPEPALSSIIKRCAKTYVSADILPGRADKLLNIEKIDQPDSSWDVIVCCHVLEHVNDKAALSEIYRILRNQSLFLCMVPLVEGWKATYENNKLITDDERKRHFGQSDHVRYYGWDFRDRLKNAGFSIREYTANGPDIVRHGLLPGEKVFACFKN